MRAGDTSTGRAVGNRPARPRRAAPLHFVGSQRGLFHVPADRGGAVPRVGHADPPVHTANAAVRRAARIRLLRRGRLPRLWCSGPSGRTCAGAARRGELRVDCRHRCALVRDTGGCVGWPHRRPLRSADLLHRQARTTHRLHLRRAARDADDASPAATHATLDHRRRPMGARHGVSGRGGVRFARRGARRRTARRTRSAAACRGPVGRPSRTRRDDQSARRSPVRGVHIGAGVDALAR